MEYIPDKNLYFAVMFALKMLKTLQSADDRKIDIAANYYHVNRNDVLKIVRSELWRRERNKAKENANSWHTIYSPRAPELLNTGFGQNFIFICPHCGAHYACNVNDGYKSDKLYTQQCSCGFIDNGQRKFIRKYFFERFMQKEV